MRGKIGVLTGGGDCPGLNAAIRAVVRTAIVHGYEVIGIRNGWQGLIANDTRPLEDHSVSGIISWGGTILGTSRTDPVKNPENFETIKRTLDTQGIGSLVVIGGDGTLSAAYEVSTRGVRLVGIPKTIDNDVFGTEVTIGFDTAVSIVTETIDRLHTTAESHHRIMVLEVMGRQSGRLALAAGMAGGADQILVPEVHVSMDEVCASLEARYRAGKKFSIVVVAEGTRHEDIAGTTVPACDRDECGHEKFVGIGNFLGKELERRLAIETRVTVLGHVQRGGSPTAQDRVLATRFGIAAVEQILESNFGCMVGLQEGRIAPVSLGSVAGRTRGLKPEEYAQAFIVAGLTGKR
ncbi:ATP-dependent 6-phosphofructokinase [Methanoregula sp.]|uniref:6-phosphofructokinase n=1 Tax=Methanoregula sp. TaxID=2052170 RepID=UPI002C4FB223|nr:ATP-dependent 6-phosphofructokinase [Methanoregula sp.]HVP97180.1 ATP-dependent 6-phosphofructokinase [Methanoregula sp.]